MNINLFKLAAMLGMGPNKGRGLADPSLDPNQPNQPSHGYTIAENKPEVVTAPGVYFPAEKGEVLSPENYNQKAGLTPLIPRQFGGEVDPSLFKDKFSVSPFTISPDVQAAQDEIARNALMNSIPNTAGASNVPATFPPVRDTTGASIVPPAPTGTTSGFGQTGMNTGYFDAHPEEKNQVFAPNPVAQAPSVNPTPFMTPPPQFKENRSSPIFASDQEAAFNKKWKPLTPLFSRKDEGVVSPNPWEALTEEEKRQYLLSSRGGEVPIEPLATPTPAPEASPFTNTFTPGIPNPQGDERARNALTSTFSVPEGPIENPSAYSNTLVLPGQEGENRWTINYPTGKSYYDVHPEEKAAQNIYDMLRPGRNDAQDWQDFRNRAALESSFGTPASKKATTEALSMSGKGRTAQELNAAQEAGKAFTGDQKTHPFHIVQTDKGMVRVDQSGNVFPLGINAPATAVKPEAAIEDQRRYQALIKKKEMQGEGSLTPGEKADIVSYEKAKTLGQEAYGQKRIEAMLSVPISVYDTHTGNIEMKSKDEVLQENATNKANGFGSRYVGAELATKIRSKSATFGEIEVASKSVRDVLANPKINFDQGQMAKIALVLKDRETRSALDNFLQGNIGKTLTPAQRDYVTALVNLKESAYALRNISGMGQGSDELRRAIAAAIPNVATPDKAYALRQLDLFDLQVRTLKQGIPGLGNEAGAIGQGVPVVPRLPNESIAEYLKRTGGK